MKVERLNGLTDAVVAIAATIMVLELNVPELENFRGLLNQWPIFFAHFLSFAIIYVLWFNHYREFARVQRVSTTVGLLNGLWLSFVTLIPFATGWIGEKGNDSLPELFYSITIFICFLTNQLMFHEIEKHNPSIEKYYITGMDYVLTISITFILAIIVAFIYPSLTRVLIFIALVIMVVRLIIDGKAQKKV